MAVACNQEDSGERLPWRLVLRQASPRRFLGSRGSGDVQRQQLRRKHLHRPHAGGRTVWGLRLAYVTYGFALNASRGLATDPLLVRFSGTDLPYLAACCSQCTGTAMAVGLLIGACVLVGARCSTARRLAFLALGLTLPGLLLQDSWRFSFFALGRGSQAFLNDTVWTVTLLPALVLLRQTGHANVFWFVFAWGAAAAVAAAIGPLQARVMPRPSGRMGMGVAAP